MKPMNELQQRKSPRAGWLEYNDGRYFVTVCTHERKSFLGDIINGVMTMTAVGRYLDNELKNVTVNHPYANMIQYVIMPNHFHAIIEIQTENVGTHRNASADDDYSQKTDALRCVPTREERLNDGIKVSCRTLLSSCIGGIKSAVTRYARANGIPFAWQSRYHDHAIRDNNDNNNISQYIANNVANWEKDCFY